MPPKKIEPKKEQIIPTITFTISKKIENMAILFESFLSETIETDTLSLWPINSQGEFEFVRQLEPIDETQNIHQILPKQNYFIYLFNIEDSVVQQQLKLDYSILLLETSFTYNQYLFPSQSQFKITITIEKPFLSNQQIQLLKPLVFNVVQLKNSTIDTQNIYVTYTFLNEKITTPKGFNNYKHVFFLHDYNDDFLNTLFLQYLVKFEIHDRDQPIDNQIIQEKLLIEKLVEEPAIIEEQVLKKDSKKEPVIKNDPKKDTKKDPKTQKKKVEPIIQLESYAKNNFGIAIFHLSQLLMPKVNSLKLSAQVLPVNEMQDFKQNLDLNKRTKEVKNLTESSYLEKVLIFFFAIILQNTFLIIEIQIFDQQFKKNIKDIRYLFERAIYIMPYNSAQLVQDLQDFYYQTNLDCFKIDSIKELSTKQLTELERTSQQLDYLTGFEIIDDESRIFIFEGLSEQAMKRLEQSILRNDSNTETKKILKNPDIRFESRIYGIFNVDLKRIRLKGKLQNLLSDPSLYIRNNMQGTILNTLMKIQNISKQFNLRQVSQFNLFPSADDLFELERKFSAPITNQDISGFDNGKKKITKLLNTKDLMTSSALQIESKDDMTQSHYQNEQPQENMIKSQLIENNASQQLPNLKWKTRTKRLDPYKIQMKNSTDSTATKNYESQMKELQLRILKDKDNYYTYSNEYLSLSISPVNFRDKFIEEKNLCEKMERINGRPKFSLSLPKSPISTIPQSVIDDIHNNPWHIQKKTAKLALEPSKKILDPDHEFKRYFNNNEIPPFPELAKVMETQITEKKKKQEEKFLGSSFFYVKTHVSAKPDQIDKLKSIMEDEVKKKGFLLPKQTIKTSKIQMTKQIESPPSSIFFSEQYRLQVDPFKRQFDRSKCVSNLHFDYYSKNTSESAIYKPKRSVQY